MSKIPVIDQRDLTRSSIVWFSVAFFLMIIPQLMLFLPIWVALLFVGCVMWRALIFRLQIDYPKWYVKLGLLIAVVAILFVTKGNFLKTEGFAVLLVSVYALKFIEARSIRDGYILVSIGIITTTVSFLFDNTPYLFVFNLLIFITLIAALIGLQQTTDSFLFSKKKLFMSAIGITVISIPLMLLLFVIFPRFPSMFPQANQQNSEGEQAQTGVSNKMEPGSIAELANSEKHILWAEFSQNIPEIQELYWRSLTLDHFDGRIWQQSEKTRFTLNPKYKINDATATQNYSVIFDSSFQSYLVTLDLSVPNSSGKANLLMISFGDFRYETTQKIREKVQYTMSYYPNTYLYTPSQGYDAQKEYQDLIAVPETNPRTSELVSQLKANSTNQEQLVSNIMNHFKQNGYSYTMSPNLMLSNNNIDEFMFDNKAGFCEHYAGATAFMLRKANIPARIVIGYLGGKINQQNKLVEVRAMDAHAWVEYWHENKGWVRLDPTAAVSPDRINFGIDNLVNELTGNSLLNQSLWNDISGKFVEISDLIDYTWTKMVLNYNADSQQSFLSQLLKTDFLSFSILIKLTIGLLLSFAILQMIWFFKPWHYFFFNIADEYQKTLKIAMRNYRVNFRKGTSPKEFADIIIPLVSSDKGTIVNNMVRDLTTYYFNPQHEGKNFMRLKKSILKTQRLLKVKDGSKGQSTQT